MRELKAAFQALASNSRLRILEALSTTGEQTVTDLADQLRMSQPLLSWHLNILRRAGVIATRRDGRLVRCSLNRDLLASCGRDLLALAGEGATTLPEQVPM